MCWGGERASCPASLLFEGARGAPPPKGGRRCERPLLTPPRPPARRVPRRRAHPFGERRRAGSKRPTEPGSARRRFDQNSPVGKSIARPHALTRPNNRFGLRSPVGTRTHPSRGAKPPEGAGRGPVPSAIHRPSPGIRTTEGRTIFYFCLFYFYFTADYDLDLDLDFRFPRGVFDASRNPLLPRF